jgi:c-di-GMP-binding flagellar brake protein YcgR
MNEQESFKNRRRYERIPCSLSVLLEGKDETLNGESVDISERGIRLIVDKMPKINSRFTLTFRSDEDLKDTTIKANLLWVRTEVSGDKFMSGFFFPKISKSDSNKLLKFLRKHIEILGLDK